MKFRLFYLGAFVFGCVSLHAASVRLAGQTFTLPDGFEIELVAGSNLVQRPVSASFDERGRLYVTDSSGSNDKPSEQLKNPTHRIVRLEDTDGDGRFDRSVVFADKVMFPQGCLWHDGSVYMAGPPSIWKFTDKNDDGTADERSEWFKGGTLTGCANDIHGPHLGPDGYIYWTKGAFDEQTHKLGNGRMLKDRAAHILRARPDGSDLDVVMTGGMDNPVEVAFTPEGEAIFTSTFIDFSKPGYRDGIGHASYGAVFGKVNGVLDDGRVKRTGPELAHPFVQLGASAPSGLCRYEGTGLGNDYRNSIFATSFNLHKVTRHVLRFQGASYASSDSDFVVSDSLDFHPTDVLEAPEGSLLIVDTGGWYKLCCPSSQLAKADVLGGIYRVKRKDSPRLNSDELATARSRIVRPPNLSDFTLPATLKRAIWRNESSNASWFLAVLEKNTAALRVAPTNHLASHLVRLCAEGLAKLREPKATAPLLEAASVVASGDEPLRAALIRALIEIGDAQGLRTATLSGGTNSASKARATLIALDQMDDGGLKAEQVLPVLSYANPSLRETALWITGRHPEWGGAMAGFFREQLSNIDRRPQSDTEKQLAQFAKSEPIQQLIASTARDSNALSAARVVALEAMSRSGLKEAPTIWFEAASVASSSTNVQVVRSAVTALRTLPTPKSNDVVRSISAALLRVATNASADEIKLEALAALPGGLRQVQSGQFDFILSNLASDGSIAARNFAATIISRARLNDAQLQQLADRLKSVGPMEISRLLPAFQRSTNEALGLRLVNALREAKSGSVVRGETLRPALTNFPPTVRQKGEEFLATHNTGAEKQRAQLEGLLKEIHGKGDVRRGQTIFNSAKAACSACHAIGYLGGKVGPDLTTIGQARSERDLLEAILFPSASFVRSYEPVLVVTKSGEDQSGVLRRESPEEILLATGANNEVRIPRSDIVELRPGTVSVMPQGLDEQLTRQELADLVAFLRNTRWGPQ